MFIDIITNYETGRRKAVKIEDVRAILYNGKLSITIQYMERKAQSVTYPTPEIAKAQYENIIAQMSAKASL